MTTTQQLYAAFLDCTGVCTDTRAINEGCLFVALKGPSFDANTFAADALANGARFVVVDDPAVVLDERYLLVADGLRALQDLARQHRRTFTIPVIAITGTNGKTTTKELAHAVLSAGYPTLATSGNLNNHIGVPLTLLRLNKEHRCAIIEMGANKPGDIAELCAIAEPTHGLVTNMGRAHLEGFGSFEGVVRTKAELFEHLRAHRGTAFVHADDSLLMQRSEGLDRITYGRGPDAHAAGDATNAGPFLAIVFVGRDALAYHAETRLIGGYNLPNALAAVALGQHFDVPDQAIAAALTTYAPGNNRSQFTDTGRNHLVLDAYNANPTSMRAALENFAAMPGDRPKLAILGDMRELGTESAKEHQAIIDLVAQLGLEAFFVGDAFASTTVGAFPSATALSVHLEATPVRGHLVLVKGSRGIKLETVVPQL